MPHYLIRIDPIPWDAGRVLCQDIRLGGCQEIATWRVTCGPEFRFFCDRHEGPPCGGVFLGEFVVKPTTTRNDLAVVLKCGVHRIYSGSGRDIHDLTCCSCGNWVGDSQDPEIEHVSLPLETECPPVGVRDIDGVRCPACEEMEAEAAAYDGS